MSDRSEYTGEGGESIMSWPRSPSHSSEEVEVRNDRRKFNLVVIPVI